tara:strand:+ start:935 stop:1180 length:246 start_codon:yes stop_codon:yes gene_type:complete
MNQELNEGAILPTTEERESIVLFQHILEIVNALQGEALGNPLDGRALARLRRMVDATHNGSVSDNRRVALARMLQAIQGVR